MARETPEQHGHEHGHDEHEHDDHQHESHDHQHGDGDHEHGDHGHDHPSGPLGWLGAIFHLHGHSHEDRNLAGDPALATGEGIRVVWIALASLVVTTVIQTFIVVASGSVALLADTVHNLVDALNSIPLLIAFYLARRAATRRYTYGFGRAEDVAGVPIVLSIVFSAGYIIWESARKLLDPQPLRDLPWVAAAAVVGFIGNEAVALLQIRTGRRMGSEAMVADGLHARIDGLTSMAVLVAAGGSALGFPIVDPLIGLLIGAAIVFIARDAAVRIWYRLLDAVEPSITDQIEQAAGAVAGVGRVANVRARWVGHELQAELFLALAGSPSLVEAQRVADAARDASLSSVQHLARVTIEIVPDWRAGTTRDDAASHTIAASAAAHPPRVAADVAPHGRSPAESHHRH